MTNFSPETPSGHEQGLLRADTIDTIHGIRDYYLEWDKAQLSHRGKALFPTRHYIIEGLANDTIPVLHHRVAMMPLPRHEPVGGITLVYLRMPTPYYERENKLSVFEDEYERHDTPQWNDVFIELRNDSSQSGKYLLNSAGLCRYEKMQTADDIETDIIRNYHDYEESGNLFIAGDEPESPALVPGFDIQMLQKILHDYMPVMQTNE